MREMKAKTIACCMAIAIQISTRTSSTSRWCVSAFSISGCARSNSPLIGLAANVNANVKLCEHGDQQRPGMISALSLSSSTNGASKQSVASANTNGNGDGSAKSNVNGKNNKKRKPKKGGGGNNKRKRNSSTSNRFSSTPPLPIADTVLAEHDPDSDGPTEENASRPRPQLTDQQITNIETIQSAKLYFSSPSVRQNSILSNSNSNSNSVYSVVIPTPPTGWRTDTKLAAARRSAWSQRGCHFGLYDARTNTVLPVPDPAVHHPSVTRAVAALELATENVATSAFQPDTGMGGLRYAQIRVERGSGRVGLTLVWNAEEMKGCQPGLARLVKELKRIDPSLWRSVWCHTNNSLGNQVFVGGEHRWHRMAGPEFLMEAIPGTDEHQREGLLYFSPQVFRHANLDGYEVIAKRVADIIPPNSKVCELYAGVGILGLTALAHHAKPDNRPKRDDDYDDWWENDNNNDSTNTNNNNNNRNNKSTDRSLAWIRCSDENPTNKRCFMKAVNSMPTEVTGIKPRAEKYKNKNMSWKDKSDAPSKEMTLQEMMEEMKRNENNSNSPPSKRNARTPTTSKTKEKVTYTTSSATRAVQNGAALGASVLLVSPPRRGLDDGVLQQICRPHDPDQPYTEDPAFLRARGAGRAREDVGMANDVETLVYVSCAFDALARDCDRILKGSAGWKLEEATGYVLFPGSNRVETLVVFRRQLGQRQ